MSQEELAKWLVGRAENDDELRHALVELSAPKNRNPAVTAGIRVRMKDIRKWAGSFIPYGQSRAVAGMLSTVEESITALADRGCVEEAAELMRELLALAEECISHADDSSGSIGDTAIYIVEAWGKLWAMIKDRDRERLAELVCDNALENEYGLKDYIVSAFADALGENGLAKLKELLEERLQEMPEPEGTDKERWHQEYKKHAIESLLRDVVKHQGNMDDFISRCRESGMLNWKAKEIAEELLAQDRPEDALAILKEGDSIPPCLKAQILLRLNRHEEAREVLWEGFTSALSEDCLLHALELMPQEEVEKAKQDALNTAEEFHEAAKAIEFLIEQNALDRAAKVIQTRRGDIRAGFYGSILAFDWQ